MTKLNGRFVLIGHKPSRRLGVLVREQKRTGLLLLQHPTRPLAAVVHPRDCYRIKEVEVRNLRVSFPDTLKWHEGAEGRGRKKPEDNLENLVDFLAMAVDYFADERTCRAIGEIRAAVSPEVKKELDARLDNLAGIAPELRTLAGYS